MDCKRAASINDEGISLIEAVVSGAVAMVIASLMLPVLQMNNQMTSNGAVSTKVQMQYEAAVSQITATARRANAVMVSGESWPPSSTMSSVSAAVVILYDESGNQIGGYQVSGTSLQEWVSGNWQNFKSGSDHVQVTGGSNFTLSGDRKWLTLNLGVFAVYGSQKDTVLSKQEPILCRN